MKPKQVSSTHIGGREFRWGARTYIMGVINVTPDSFSGDGVTEDPDSAVSKAVEFAGLGADIIDIGAESTRPGALPITEDEELKRLIPTLKLIRPNTNLPVSIDTYKYGVANQAIALGATIINDIWGLRKEPRLAEIAAESGAALVLMHNQVGTDYVELVQNIIESLSWSIGEAQRRGVPMEKIIIDPGFGFGKTAEQNLEILRHLDEFRVLGRPILIGTSRKSTIGLVLDLPLQERLEGTAATIAIAIANGADIVRVHDVKEMTLVSRMTDAIVRGWKATN